MVVNLRTGFFGPLANLLISDQRREIIFFKMKLDRKKAPPISLSGELKLPDVKVSYLDNGIPVYDLRMGTQEVVKLEIAFLAGRPFESKSLAARATTALLKEGSQGHSGAEIAEEFDFYGSTLSTPVSLDSSNITLYTLVKYFEPLLSLLTEMLTRPIFPERELLSFIHRNQQRLKVDLAKNDVVAYRKITEFIFGSDHPYGYNSFPETYANLKRKDLIAHFNRLFVAENCKVFISGKTNDQLISLLNRYLGKAIPHGERAVYFPPRINRQAAKVHIPFPSAIQTAIRIGRHLFDKKHPDFNGMYVLNTILGGYFGSRLMENIREDKGYTYNIYSTVDTMLYDGCFYIGAEVGNEFAAPTLKEIYKELQLLQEENVSEEDMEMVRNYLLGNFLAILDGPFNVSELIRSMILEGIPFTHFEDLVRTVHTITPEKIRELAGRYLQPADMWEVVIGGKE